MVCKLKRVWGSGGKKARLGLAWALEALKPPAMTHTDLIISKIILSTRDQIFKYMS